MDENETKLTIVEGGYYRNRQGEKVGPMELLRSLDDTIEWQGRSSGEKYACHWFHADGRRWIDANQPETDLIAPWVEPAKPVYRVGDEVWVRNIVTGVFSDGSGVTAKPLHAMSSRCIGHYAPSDLAGHIPAPREIEVGCRVRNGAGVVYQVLAIDEDEAWVKRDGWRGSVALSNLTRID